MDTGGLLLFVLELVLVLELGVEFGPVLASELESVLASPLEFVLASGLELVLEPVLELVLELVVEPEPELVSELPPQPLAKPTVSNKSRQQSNHSDIELHGYTLLF